MAETDENKENQDQAEGDEINLNQKDAKIKDTSDSDVEDFEIKYKETYDLLLREKAEMENLKKRTEKEKEFHVDDLDDVDDETDFWFEWVIIQNN